MSTVITFALLPMTVFAQTGAQVPEAIGLEQALQSALDNYPTARAALEQINASSAAVSVAKAASLPRLDAVWQTNRATANNIFGQVLPQSVIPSMSGPVLTDASWQSVWGTAVGGLFSWEPFDFGLRDASVDEAEAVVGRARAQEGLTRLAVQRAVGLAFLNVLTARQALAAADADVQRREVLARAAQTLADNQLRPGAEASRADAELAAARTRVIQLRQVLIAAEATLGLTLGISDRPVVSAGRLLDVEPTPLESSSPVSAHPVVQAGKAAVAVARTQEQVLQKTDRPRVYLQSSVFARGSGATPDGHFDGGADGLLPERANWAAGVQVVFPNVFSHSALRSRQASAGALTRAESARYDEAVLSVTAEQRTADAMVEAARDVARNTPIQLTAARQTESQARARYDAGLAGIVEVADAQTLLATAEYQNAAARIDVWRALLAQATARGDVPSFIDALHRSGVR